MSQDPDIDLSAYAGRWVALVGTGPEDRQVAGVGYTAAEAEQLARRNRPREKFQLRFIEPPGGERLPLSPLMASLRPLLSEQSMPVYLVGGAVRDALLDRVSDDLDFVVPQQAIKLTFQVADRMGWPAYVLDRERDTGRVVVGEGAVSLDFARFRGDDLEADLQDRDFTINALALPATAVTRASVIDPTGGMADLAAKVLRLTHPEAIQHDPVRALRAVRLGLRLGFRLAPETRAAAMAAAGMLDQVSPERIRDELLKLVSGEDPAGAVAQLQELQLLAVVWPELASLVDVAQTPPHHEPVLAHTISVLRWLVKLEGALLDETATDERVIQQAQAMLWPYREQLVDHLARRVDGNLNGWMLLRLGALFHDVGKQATQSVEATGRIRFLGHEQVGAEMAMTALRQYRLSNEAINHVGQIVAGHMRPLHLVQSDGVSRRAAYRFYRAVGTAGFDICLLTLADHLATYQTVGEEESWPRLLAVVAELLRIYEEQHAEVVAPPPLLNGRDLIRLLGMKPGREVGRLLRLLEEGQAAGEIHTRDEALKFAQANRATTSPGEGVD